MGDFGLTPKSNFLRNLGSARSTARSEKSETGEGNDDEIREDAAKAQRIACCMFIQLIVFIIGFLILVVLHEDIQHVYKLEHVMDIELTKQFGHHSHDIYDVNDIDEVWHWVTEAFVPTMINHKDEVGHFLPHEDWGYLADYNRIIGGIRFYQERSDSHECHYDLHEFYGKCQPIDTQSHHSFGYPDCSAADDTLDDHSDDHSDDGDDEFDSSHNITACYNADHYLHNVDLGHDEGFTVDYTTNTFEMWIDLFDTEEVIWNRIEYLEDRHWLDRKTKSVTIEFLTYNGQEEPLLCKSVINFQFTRVGYVTPSLQIETIPLSPYFSNVIIKGILEALFVLLVLDMIVSEVKKVKDRHYENRKADKESKFHVVFYKTIKDHYTSTDYFGNILNLVNIIVGSLLCYEWILIVTHLQHLTHLLTHLHRPSGDVSYDDTDADVWSDYHHELVEVEAAVDLAIYDMKTIRILSVIVVLTMIFDLFKVWEGIPALRGVAQTISIAGNGLMSFSLVLGCLITLFGGAGMLAFGQQMEEFHDIISAIISTLTIMTTGDSEIYEKQYKLNPLIATIWYWMLVCIMYLVCLNLVLCILVDAYGEANAAISDDDDHIPSLYEQGRDTVAYLFQIQFKQVAVLIKKEGVGGLIKQRYGSSGTANTSRAVSPKKSVPSLQPIDKTDAWIKHNQNSGEIAL